MEPDLIIDRRKLKRRLAVWRVVAILAIVGALLLAVPRDRWGSLAGAKHVARFTIAGVITNPRRDVEALDRLRRDPLVAAVLLHIDSPGGSAYGGEALNAAVARLARAKPVVAVMDSVAASGGYMLAVAAPHIVAREGTITGSIGVISEAPDASGLLDKIGVKIEPITSGPLKGQPSGVAPLTPQGRDMLQGLVNDAFNQFVDLVAAGRHMDRDKVKALADGRPYTGRQARAAGLIDEIGGEEEARHWLTAERQIPSSLPVEDAHAEGYVRRFTLRLMEDLALDAREALGVDGLWTVWQPVLAPK